MIKVSLQEARALKAFRAMPEADIIKGVVLRELNVARDEYEKAEVDPEVRKRILVYRSVLGTLFDEPLGRGE